MAWEARPSASGMRRVSLAGDGPPGFPESRQTPDRPVKTGCFMSQVGPQTFLDRIVIQLMQGGGDLPPTLEIQDAREFADDRHPAIQKAGFVPMVVFEDSFPRQFQRLHRG